MRKCRPPMVGEGKRDVVPFKKEQHFITSPPAQKIGLNETKGSKKSLFTIASALDLRS